MDKIQNIRLLDSRLTVALYKQEQALGLEHLLLLEEEAENEAFKQELAIEINSIRVKIANLLK